MGTTIENSSTTTQNEIKDLSDDAITTRLGDDIAQQSDLNAAESVGDTNTDDIAVLQSQVGDAIPGNIFSMSIANNTLVASIATVVTPTFKSWQIVVDSDVEPTTGFTSSSTITTTYTVADWDAHTYYLWVIELNDTVTQIPPSNSQSDGETVPGLIVNAKSTIPPTQATSFSVVVGASDPTSEADVTWVDSTSNAEPITYDVYRLVNEATTILLAADASTPATIANLNSGETYEMFVRATDADGLSSDSDVDGVTLSTGANGIVSIVDASVVKEVDDDTATLNIALQITGRTQTAQTSTVTVSTVDDTALGGTNFTALSSTTITFPANDNNNVDAAITITTALESVLNLTAQLHIDAGSEGSDGGSGFYPAIAAYPDNATIFKINGTGTTSTDAYEQTGQVLFNPSTDIDDANDEIDITGHPYTTEDAVRYEKNLGTLIVGLTDNTTYYVRSVTANSISLHPTPADATTPANKIAIAAGSDEYHSLFSLTRGDQVIVLEAEDYSSIDNKGWTGDRSWEDRAGDDDGTGINLNDYVGDGFISGGSTLADFTSFVDALASAPQINHTVNFTQTGVHYLWTRRRIRVASHRYAWVGFGGADNFTVAKLTHDDVSDPSLWTWTKHTGTYNVTVTGDQVLNTYKYANWANIDRMILTDSNTYDPSALGAAGAPGASENEGPAASKFLQGSAAVDDANNITVPTVPAPGTASYDPTPGNGGLATPVDDSTAVSTLQTLKFQWPLGTHTIQATITVADSATNTVAGTTLGISSDGTYGEGLTWSPTQTMAEAEAHDVTISGTCIDPTGVSKTINYITYDFTTFDSGSADVIWTTDFSAYTADTDMTLAQAKSELNSTFGIGFGEASSIYTTSGTNNFSSWVDDPKGVRGTVMKMQLPPGTYYGDDVTRIMAQTDFSDPSSDDIWLAYSVYFSPEFKFASGFKLPGLKTFKAEPQVAGQAPVGGYCSGRFTAHGDLYDSSVPDFHPYKHIPDGGVGVFAAYSYYKGAAARTQFMNATDPDVRLTTDTIADSTASHYLITNGEWIRLKMHFKLNSTDAAADGNMTWYVNGVEMWNTGRGTDDVTLILPDTYPTCIWDHGSFSHFWGGGDSLWRSPDDQEQYCLIDNMIISKADPDA